jgi:hypothetical protein
MKKRLLAFFCTVFFCSRVFCADPATQSTLPQPYEKDEFPEWARYVRRTEIITLGMLPFVTLGTTLGYSVYRYFQHDMNASYFPNPLAKTSQDANLTQEEQLTVLAISAGISLFLGLVDLTITLIKDGALKKNAVPLSGSITVIEVQEEESSEGDPVSFFVPMQANEDKITLLSFYCRVPVPDGILIAHNSGENPSEL